jgi:hypothetical protein
MRMESLVDKCIEEASRIAPTEDKEGGISKGTGSLTVSLHPPSTVGCCCVYVSAILLMARVQDESKDASKHEGDGAASRGAGSGSGSGSGSSSSAESKQPAVGSIEEAVAALNVRASSGGRPQLAAALRTLIKCAENVLENPAVDRFRQIPLSNAKFQEKVGSLPGRPSYQRQRSVSCCCLGRLQAQLAY